MTTTILRKQPRNPTKFDALEIFGAWAQQENVPITAENGVARFADFLGRSLQESLGSPIALYGGRTQAMFEAVVANLGHVQERLANDPSHVGQPLAWQDGLAFPKLTGPETWTVA